MRIELVRGDITQQRDVEAIVTAARSTLTAEGGVNGAVHRAAGPELLRACRELASCPAGSAVVTPAFDLAPVKWVIHAVGAIYSGPDENEAEVLGSAYHASLARADEVGARSVAFPCISAGVYGYPIKDAAHVSVEALRRSSSTVELVKLVAFNEPTFSAWVDVLVEPQLAARLEEVYESETDAFMTPEEFHDWHRRDLPDA